MSQKITTTKCFKRVSSKMLFANQIYRNTQKFSAVTNTSDGLFQGKVEGKGN